LNALNQVLLEEEMNCNDLGRFILRERTKEQKTRVRQVVISLMSDDDDIEIKDPRDDPNWVDILRLFRTPYPSPFG